jgi:hypothetical protein
MRFRKAAFGLVCMAALLIGSPAAVAKLPPGSTFEACGASGCMTTSKDETLALQVRLIEPTIDHGGRPAPTTDHAWVRVDLKLGATDSGMSLGSVRRDFPVVYAAGLLGVPRADNTYRWTKLDSRNSAAYDQLASAVSPFPPESLAALTPSGVERVEPGLTANPPSDTEGFPVWILAAIIAVAAGLAGLAGLRRKSRPSMRHEPV